MEFKYYYKFKVMLKHQIFSFVFAGIGLIAEAQNYQPYSKNGYYTLNGSYELSTRAIFDESGRHIGSDNYNWSDFNNIFYSYSSLLNGIVYLVVNKNLATVGQVVNGKMSGLWINLITDINDENFRKIKELSVYENGVLKKKIYKDFTHNNKECSDVGFFDFGAANQQIGVLYDVNGMNVGYDEFDYKSGLYTLAQSAFSGIGYLNDTGICYMLISSFKNGFYNGLFINSNEGGYVSEFGEMNMGNKIGKWLENEYTGQILRYGNYLNNKPTGYMLFFNENIYVGRSEYSINGDLINCLGTCE